MDFQDITLRKQQQEQRSQLEEELRQAQKLEALGILASGIAHEINTPVQFIGDNLRFLEDAFRDLIATARKPSDDDDGDRTPGDDELDYLSREVPEAVQHSLEGVSRIAEIVAAVREFSHPGTKDKMPMDINRAIDSTITLSTNHWKYVAEIETDFDTELPEVECVPGEFNQVVLNLVVNAAHAIEEKSDTDKGRITISTRHVGGHAELRVSDTGCGIPDSVRTKIFDPFFTTKDVGKGTGQGLSLVHSIVVQKHGGSLRFETEAGVGTTFVVQWPITAETTAHQAA